MPCALGSVPVSIDECDGDVVEFERDGERVFISRAKYARPEDHPMIRRLREAGEHMTMSAEEWRSMMRDPEDEL